MGQLTLRFIIYDPLELLKQTVKDREIQPIQMAYWAIVLMNAIKAPHVEKRDSGRFLTVFTRVPVITPSATQDKYIVENRKYFQLPGAIFDFDMDNGIEYVAYTSDGSPGCPPEYTHVRFHRTAPSKVWSLYADPYTKPTPDKPAWSLAKDIVTTYGIETVNVPEVELGMYMPIAPPSEIDLDEPIEFPEERIALLQRQLYDIGRLGLLIPADKIADGSADPQGVVPNQKIASVNQPPAEQQQ